MNWFSFLTIVVFLGFTVPISINMIKIIIINRGVFFDINEEKEKRVEIRKRRNRILMLTIFLILSMFLSFGLAWFLERS